MEKKIYQDNRGYLFKVIYDPFDSAFRGFFNRNRPKVCRWDRMSHFKPKATFEEAQRDLDELAKKKGWKNGTNTSKNI